MLYYFIDKNGSKKLARKSDNDYYYGIAYLEITGERIITCSKKREALVKKINYMTKGFYAEQLGQDLSKYWSDQFVNPSKLRIVNLIK